jgi:hypothetical protein
VVSILSDERRGEPPESTERRCTVVWRKKTRIGVHFG